MAPSCFLPSSECLASLDCMSTSSPIICDASGAVTSIVLKKHNLSGFLSSSLGALTSLVLLDLSENALQSTIPKQFGALSKLKQLYLYANNLTGKCKRESSFHFWFLFFFLSDKYVMSLQFLRCQTHFLRMDFVKSRARRLRWRILTILIIVVWTLRAATHSVTAHRTIVQHQPQRRVGKQLRSQQQQQQQ